MLANIFPLLGKDKSTWPADPTLSPILHRKCYYFIESYGTIVKISTEYF